MKDDPEFRTIRQNMLPGKFSAEGFLGDDDRSLVDILRDDQAVVERLGLTHVIIAQKMKYLTRQGKAGLEKPIVVDDAYEVVVEEFMGRIPCPYRDSWGTYKRNTTVKRLRDGKVLIWSDMGIHLIADHGFYQGLGSPFRIDPEELAEFLGLS
ncbi:MAG: hypothetical protein GX749_09360 [Ruminococcaceae bacterium]|nr:hypothetical protein [Oscillospiraceae bacterium]